MWNDMDTPLIELREKLREFNDERDWAQFHSPKDLAMCVATESAELLECFLWKRDGDTHDLGRIREELADVFITLTNLASKLDVDMMSAVQDKLALNAKRYPVDKAKGRSTKHTAL